MIGFPISVNADVEKRSMETWKTGLILTFFSRMSLVEVVGKQYKRVPVLLTQTMVEAIQALVDKRAEGGVRSCNPYVFAQVLLQSLHLRT